MSLEHLEPIEAREKREKQPWDYSHVPLPTSWYGLPLLFASVANPQLESASFRASNSNGNRRSDLFASSVSYSTLIIIDHWAGSAVGLSKKGLQKCGWRCYDMVMHTWKVLSKLHKWRGQWGCPFFDLQTMDDLCVKENGDEWSTYEEFHDWEAKFPWISHISQPAQHASWHPNRWPSFWNPTHHCPAHVTHVKIVMQKMSSGASPCIFFSISAWPQPKSTAMNPAVDRHGSREPRYRLQDGGNHGGTDAANQHKDHDVLSWVPAHVWGQNDQKYTKKSFLLIIEVWITDSIWIIFVHLPFRILWGVFFSRTMYTTSWQNRLQHSEMPRMTQARWCNDGPGWASLQWKIKTSGQLGQPSEAAMGWPLFDNATWKLEKSTSWSQGWCSRNSIKDAIWKKREVDSPWRQHWDEPLRTHRTSAARTCAREHPVKAPLCGHT